MTNSFRLGITALALVMLLPAPARAQQCGQPADVIIVLDRSGSMSSSSKWTYAKTAVNTLTSQYKTAMNFALMLFPGPAGSCSTAIMDVPVAPNNGSKITWKLNSTGPTGMTPMAAALNSAKGYLAGMKVPKKRYVLLITDGSPNCTPSNPIPPVQQLLGMGIKTFVVGFGSGVNASTLNNLANAGGTAKATGTKYYQANSATDLKTVLSTIGGLMSCCGNGKKESWEKCEKNLPAGAPGACIKDPKKCPYKKCMEPYLKGSACDVECAWKAVTAAKSGDGCCPPGANFNTDKDCPANCGNGILEANEVCDPGIKSGPGKCKTVADCKDSDPCTTETVTGPACHRVCVITKSKPGIESTDGCCPKGMSKIDDADCPPPCGPDQLTNCIDLCKGVSCPSGSCCNYGTCKPCGSGGGTTPPPGVDAGSGGGSYDDAGNWNPGGGGYYDDAGNWVPGGGGTGGYYDDAGNWVPGGGGTGGGLNYGDISSGCACNTGSGDRVPLAGLLIVALGMAIIRRRR